MENTEIRDTRLLIDQIKKGNVLAFERFIEKYQRLVFHIVFRMIPNKTDCEDLCQDIFLKIYQYLPQFRFESKLSTWIAKIAYHTCLNHIKKLRIPLFGDLPCQNEFLETIADNSIRPDLLTEEWDISAKVQEEIDKMEVHYRTILTLYHLQEMDYAEIGEIMDLPEGTVKSYLFRARRQLKQKLDVKYRREEIWA